MDDILSQVLADPAVGAIGAAVLVAGVALWLAAAWWAYTDAARRSESNLAAVVAAGWIVISTPLLMPMALGIYALARPQSTASEHRTRRLAAALVDIGEAAGLERCASCRAPADPAWLRCPSCTAWLAAPCSNCAQWSDPALGACPWCGSEDRTPPAVVTPEPLDAPSSRRRRGRRRLRGVGPGLAHAQRPAVRRSPLDAEARPLAPLRGR